MAFSECILYFIIKTKEGEEKEKREGRRKTGRKKREIKPYAQEKESCGGRRSNILNKWVQNVNFIPVF